MTLSLPTLPPRRFLAGALASALLLLLAQPPFRFLPLPFLALVPLVSAVASLPSDPRGRWQAAMLGLSFGAFFWGAELVWVPLVVGRVFLWAYPGYLILLLLLGGLSGAFGGALHALHVRRGVPLALAVPLAWVSVEWIKANAPFGLAFPWLGLGVTLTPWPELLGTAEWVGEPGIAFWIASVNGLAAAVLLGREGEGRLLRSAVLGVLVLLPAFAGLLRSGSLELVDGPTVAAVGTSAWGDPRAPRSTAAGNGLDQVLALAPTMDLQGVDLVLLPEATLRVPLEEEGGREGLRQLTALVGSWKAPVVFGGIGSRGNDPGSPSLTNSAFLISQEGLGLNRYDKIRLVPGMELGRYLGGSEFRTFAEGGWSSGPLICYESLFGGLARGLRNDGAQVLLNLTSDVWFGRWPTLLGWFFLPQHPAHLVLRVVENRIPAVRAANGGFTLLLDPVGHWVGGVVPPTGGWVRGRLTLYQGSTLFTRTGDWVSPASLGLLLLMLWPLGEKLEGLLRRSRGRRSSVGLN